MLLLGERCLSALFGADVDAVAVRPSIADPSSGGLPQGLVVGVRFFSPSGSLLGRAG